MADIGGPLWGRQVPWQGQVRVQLLGVDSFRQRSGVTLSAVALEPALGPTEVLPPVASGQQLAFGWGVGEGPEGGRALMVTL